MRTEVKIGVAVGLLVAAIAVAYFFINNRNQNKPPEVANTEPEKNKVLPPLPPPDSGLPQVPPSPGAIPTTGPVVISSAVTPPPTTMPSIEVVSRTPTTEPLRVEPVTPVGVSVVRPGETIAPVSAEADKIHTVATGESLWSIAAKEYGDGSKWTNIVAANPGLTKNSVLRLGQKIKIPGVKAPVTPGTGAGVTGVVPPTVDVAPTGIGSTEYVVQDGDAGLWGIAAKVYKDGNLWPAIQKANKDVKPSQLRKGQKLVIPSIEDARKMLNMTSGTTAGTTTAPRSGGRTGTGSGATSSGGAARPSFD